MQFEDGIKLIRKGYDKVAREELRDIWLARSSLMDKDNYISFEEFYKLSKTPPSKNEKSPSTTKPPRHYTKDDVAEIIQMAEKIKKAEENSRKQNVVESGESDGTI